MKKEDLVANRLFSDLNKVITRIYILKEMLDEILPSCSWRLHRCVALPWRVCRCPHARLSWAWQRGCWASWTVEGVTALKNERILTYIFGIGMLRSLFPPRLTYVLKCTEEQFTRTRTFSQKRKDSESVLKRSYLDIIVCMIHRVTYSQDHLINHICLTCQSRHQKMSWDHSPIRLGSTSLLAVPASHRTQTTERPPYSLSLGT